MDPRHPHARELVVLAVTIVGMSRLLDGPLTWIVAVLVGVAVWIGGRQVIAEGGPGYAPVPFEASILPAVLAAGSVGAIRLVPLGLVVLPAIAGVGWLLDRTLAAEARVHDRPTGMTPGDRSILLALALVGAFLAFAGAASMIPGGLAEPPAVASPGIPGGVPPGDVLGESGLVGLAAADAIVAGLIGFRFSAVRLAGRRDALWAALTYGAAIAIGAGLIRAVAVPRLVFPALLTLVLYLWDTLRGTAPSLRRDPRFLWQSGLLVILAVVVVVWNVGLRPR